MEFKKRFLSTFIFILLILLAYIFVFRGYSINEFIITLKELKTSYLIIAILCVCLWVFFEALFFKVFYKKLGYKISFFNAIGYVFTETYFSAITPSSTGGQPVQMIEMSKDKIPYRTSSIVVLVNTIFYKLSLLLVIIIGFIVYHRQILHFSPLFRAMSIWGFIITSLIVFFFLLLIFSEKTINKILKFILNILSKIRKTSADEKEDKINNALNDYKDAAKYIRKNPKTLFKTFLIIFAQRISMLMVNYFVYKSFNVNDISIFYAITINAFLMIAVDFMPFPGGVLISEALLIEVNKRLHIFKISKSMTLVFRNISFYFLVIASLIGYLIFHFSKRKGAIKTH